MSMFPAFIIGFIVGVWVAVMYYICKRDVIPSETKIHTLEHYIESLKDDVALLEKENASLREELKNKQEK